LTAVCKDCMLAASVSKVVLRSSPMVLAAACGDWDEDRADEDRRDRDTRLSRASGPRVAGPRLRSS
jgi:hypothetical protein